MGWNAGGGHYTGIGGGASMPENPYQGNGGTKKAIAGQLAMIAVKKYGPKAGRALASVVLRRPI